MATEAQRHEENPKTILVSSIFFEFLCVFVTLWPIHCPAVVRFDLEMSSMMQICTQMFSAPRGFSRGL